ncbi:AMP-binding protein [Rhodococcus sp. MEB041]|uniref:AMP-binding protein n=1 Tax=Rhodococcus sp. MEB041 TaxID=3040323 RepID=UPI00254AD62E|nr:AMP-binding protein [Rhodococcus sp. MEB041]
METATDDRTAVTIGGASLGWSELRSAADASTPGLAGVTSVAVRATPTVETVVAVVAALRAGVSVVPVPPDSGPSECAHIVSDSGAEAWFGEPGDPLLPHIGIDGSRTGEPLTARTGDKSAMVLYTSGTTGPPKGVQLNMPALAACLDGLAEAWAWTADDVVAHGLPLYHVHGLILGLLGPLRVGSPVIHTGRPTPDAYADASASMYFGVPTVWTRVVADPAAARRLGDARLLVSGSAALPSQVFTQLHELTGHRPVERYGMSETLITLSTRADDPDRIAGTVGRPLRGLRTRIVDPAGDRVAADGTTVGRLHVQGATLFDGYVGGIPGEWTEDGWFVTGDVATVDADGLHRIVGRESTDLIKSGGYRIGAGEIESCLLGHPSVAEVAVVGEADDDLGQRIVAFVVSEGDVTNDTARQLIDHVATELSNHKRPREIRFVDDLPRNSMGKVQKKLLLR